MEPLCPKWTPPKVTRIPRNSPKTFGGYKLRAPWRMSARWATNSEAPLCWVPCSLLVAGIAKEYYDIDISLVAFTRYISTLGFIQSKKLLRTSNVTAWLPEAYPFAEWYRITGVKVLSPHAQHTMIMFSNDPKTVQIQTRVCNVYWRRCWK